MAKNKIRTVEEFKTVLDTLCLDLAGANDHYALFRKLLAAKEGAYAKALSQSQAFWSLTYGAHFETAVFRLCRAYDQEPAALTLKTFLETVKAQPPFLPKPQMFQRVDSAQLDTHLAWVDRDTNPLVEHLMMWRHKVYAHRDVRKTVMANLAQEHPVTHDDVTVLLETGFNILNHYNAVFFASHFGREMHGLEDYEKVLKALQDRVEIWEAQFEAEAQRARQNSDEG